MFLELVARSNSSLILSKTSDDEEYDEKNSGVVGFGMNALSSTSGTADKSRRCSQNFFRMVEGNSNQSNDSFLDLLKAHAQTFLSFLGNCVEKFPALSKLLPVKKVLLKRKLILE